MLSHDSRSHQLPSSSHITHSRSQARNHVIISMIQTDRHYIGIGGVLLVISFLPFLCLPKKATLVTPTLAIHCLLLSCFIQSCALLHPCLSGLFAIVRRSSNTPLLRILSVLTPPFPACLSKTKQPQKLAVNSLYMPYSRNREKTKKVCLTGDVPEPELM